jgi:pyrethroid hydrolase
MSVSVLAHYLTIDWQEPGVARQIEISSDPIEIEISADGTMRAETQIFKDLHPWVGLRPMGKLGKVHPHLVCADGTRLPWLRILGGDGQVWWVLESGWSRHGNRHLSEMHRSVGRFEVAIGQQRLFLDNIALELDRAGAEDYLEDFRDELAWLALGKASGATAEASVSHDKDLIAALSDFVTAARRILDHPAHDIRETTALSSAARLRPNATTFREVLRHPGARRYPGRSAQESADISENRYMRHMVQVCEGLSRRIARSCSRHGQQYAARAEREQARSVELSAMKTQEIDPEVLENQINDLKARIEAIANWRSQSASTENQIREYSLRVGEVYNSLSNCLFYNREDGSPANDIERGIQYSVIQLPKGFFDIVEAAIRFDNKLCLVLHGVAQIQRDGKRRLARFSEVVRASPRSPMLDGKERRREHYSRNGWRRILTKSEREEYRQEARVVQLRAKRSSARAELSMTAATVLSTVHGALRHQDDGWGTLDVSASAQFPMSMLYVQNPDYAAALSAFRRVRDIADQAGIGGEGFERVERINILHASALYERWCLVKMISVLVEDFGFAPQADWVDRVVTGVRGPIESFVLDFQRASPEMIARLEVQPGLANGRRPDFRLRFHHRNGEPSPVHFDFSSGRGLRRGVTWNRAAPGKQRGIVMDAKFRTHWRRGELERKLDELVTTKDYGQDGNRVFILQPSRATVQHRTSPLVWGKDCDFGQDSPTSHNRGTIRLASDDSATDNLRRLVALELQSGFGKPVCDELTSVCTSVSSFCIRCGAGHEPLGVEQRKTRNENPYWVFSCVECEMKTTRTHCFGCGNPLHKNGFQLTYHLTIADQLMNIVCPDCGQFFDADVYNDGEVRKILREYDEADP